VDVCLSFKKDGDIQTSFQIPLRGSSFSRNVQEMHGVMLTAFLEQFLDEDALQERAISVKMVKKPTKPFFEPRRQRVI
jgi:hypothetical protein